MYQTPDFFYYSYLRTYLKQLAITFKNVKITDEYINFRCNICGDSKVSIRKKRGYIVFKFMPFYFICHNCGNKMAADRWFKKYYPERYKAFIREYLSQHKSNTEQEKKLEIQEKQILDYINKEKEKKELENIKFFRPITINHPLAELARKYCKKRCIPDSVYLKWYIAIDGLYKDRLIIPFYDKKGNIFYYQARALKGQEPKYLSRLKNKEEAIYNWDFVNKNLIVIILEGPINSLFIKNSIAICGSTLTHQQKEKINTLPKRYFIFDNDETGKQKSIKMIKAGEMCLNWTPFLLHLGITKFVKDINDLVLVTGKEKWTFEDFKPYMTNNIYDTVLFGI